MANPTHAAPAQKPVKKSMIIAGHATSLSLEPVFWQALEAMAKARSLSLRALIEEIDTAPRAASLSSALRVRALLYYQQTPYQK